jgi:hypothetical protein
MGSNNLSRTKTIQRAASERTSEYFDFFNVKAFVDRFADRVMMMMGSVGLYT